MRTYSVLYAAGFAAVSTDVSEGSSLLHAEKEDKSNADVSMNAADLKLVFLVILFLPCNFYYYTDYTLYKAVVALSVIILWSIW